MLRQGSDSGLIPYLERNFLNLAEVTVEKAAFFEERLKAQSSKDVGLGRLQREYFILRIALVKDTL